MLAELQYCDCVYVALDDVLQFSNTSALDPINISYLIVYFCFLFIWSSLGDVFEGH